VDDISYGRPTQEYEYNFDYGRQAHSVWATTMNIEEGDSFPRDNEGGDTSFLNKLNDLLWAEPDPSSEGLGLGWTNTRMLAISEQIIKNTLDDQFITMSPTDVSTSALTLPTPNPTENPTVLPTEVPSTLPIENPSVLPTEGN